MARSNKTPSDKKHRQAEQTDIAATRAGTPESASHMVIVFLLNGMMVADPDPFFSGWTDTDFPVFSNAVLTGNAPQPA